MKALAPFETRVRIHSCLLLHSGWFLELLRFFDFSCQVLVSALVSVLTWYCPHVSAHTWHCLHVSVLIWPCPCGSGSHSIVLCLYPHIVLSLSLYPHKVLSLCLCPHMVLFLCLCRLVALSLYVLTSHGIYLHMLCHLVSDFTWYYPCISNPTNCCSYVSILDWCLLIRLPVNLSLFRNSSPPTTS